MDRGETVREFYRRQGEQRERDRIIALLEENHQKYWITGNRNEWNHNPEFCFACDFIALIKDDK